MTERFDLVVVGGGPAGLAHAFWRLRARPELRVAVLEAAATPGGWVRTEHVDGFSLELGPQALRPSDALDALVDALGLAGDVVPASAHAKVRRIGRGGRLLDLPGGPGSFLTSRVLPLSAKLRLFREPFVGRPGTPDPTESVAAFVGRRFGKHAVPLVQAMVSGIFAGDADRLEVASAFPMLAEAEREHGSVFSGMKAKARAARAARGGAPRPHRPPLVTFTNGLSTLTDRLAATLGDRLHLDATVSGLARTADGYRVALGDGRAMDAAEVVCACPARVTATLVRALDAELAAELAAVPFASLASVYLDLDTARVTPELTGFGFLLEPSEPSPVLGGLSCSALFPAHAPPGRFLLRVMIGGRNAPEIVDASDDALVAHALQALRGYGRYDGPARTIRIARVRDAIPQYENGHGARLARLAARLEEHHPGLRLRGNSYRAIALTGQLGVPDAATV